MINCQLTKKITVCLETRWQHFQPMQPICMGPAHGHVSCESWGGSNFYFGWTSLTKGIGRQKLTNTCSDSGSISMTTPSRDLLGLPAKFVAQCWWRGVGHEHSQFALCQLCPGLVGSLCGVTRCHTSPKSNKWHSFPQQSALDHYNFCQGLPYP